MRRKSCSIVRTFGGIDRVADGDIGHVARRESYQAIVLAERQTGEAITASASERVENSSRSRLEWKREP